MSKKHYRTLDIEEDSKLSIAVLEIVDRTDKQAEPTYHSLLGLFQYSGKNRPIAWQYLHFHNKEGASRFMVGGVVPPIKLLPNDAKSTNDRNRNNKYFPYVSGYAVNLLPVWNHALSCTANIHRQKIKFGENFRYNPYASNCRRGVIDIITASGLNFRQDFAASVAGIAAPPIENLRAYNWNSKPPAFNVSLALNEALYEALCPDTSP